MEYKILFPTLTCDECCFPHSKTLILVGNSDYLHSNNSTNRWYDGVFMSSFAQLAAHYAHLTVSERSSVLGDSYKQPLLLHVTYTNQILQEGKYKALPDHVTKVVAVMHNRDHYAMMEIDIPVKKDVIFDGLHKELDKWIDHVVSGMKRCMLLSLDILSPQSTNSYLEVRYKARGHIPTLRSQKTGFSTPRHSPTQVGCKKPSSKSRSRA